MSPVHLPLVRRLAPEDAAAYQSLRLRGLQESPDSFSASYADESDRTLDEVQARLSPAADGSRCVFGAFENDSLAGFLAFLRPERAKLRHWAELAGMYVVPEMRRRRFGGALIDAAVSHARALPGLRQLKLGVNGDNLPARLLYVSRGFRCVGSHPEALFVSGRYYDEEFYVLSLSPFPRTRGA
jgi:RimJ/RimL family protein N-acetyltransferase